MFQAQIYQYSMILIINLKYRLKISKDHFDCRHPHKYSKQNLKIIMRIRRCQNIQYQIVSSLLGFAFSLFCLFFFLLFFGFTFFFLLGRLRSFLLLLFVTFGLGDLYFFLLFTGFFPFAFFILFSDSIFLSPTFQFLFILNHLLVHLHLELVFFVISDFFPKLFDFVIFFVSITQLSIFGKFETEVYIEWLLWLVLFCLLRQSHENYNYKIWRISKQLNSVFIQQTQFIIFLIMSQQSYEKDYEKWVEIAQGEYYFSIKKQHTLEGYQIFYVKSLLAGINLSDQFSGTASSYFGTNKTQLIIDYDFHVCVDQDDQFPESLQTLNEEIKNINLDLIFISKDDEESYWVKSARKFKKQVEIVDEQLKGMLQGCTVGVIQKVVGDKLQSRIDQRLSDLAISQNQS